MEALGLGVTAARGCAQWIKWDGWSWVHMPIILALEKWGRAMLWNSPFLHYEYILLSVVNKRLAGWWLSRKSGGKAKLRMKG